MGACGERVWVAGMCRGNWEGQFAVVSEFLLVDEFECVSRESAITAAVLARRLAGGSTPAGFLSSAGVVWGLGLP